MACWVETVTGPSGVGYNVGGHCKLWESEVTVSGCGVDGTAGSNIFLPKCGHQGAGPTRADQGQRGVSGPGSQQEQGMGMRKTGLTLPL